MTRARKNNPVEMINRHLKLVADHDHTLPLQLVQDNESRHKNPAHS